MKDLEVEGLAAKATQQPENDRQVSKQELSNPTISAPSAVSAKIAVAVQYSVQPSAPLRRYTPLVLVSRVGGRSLLMIITSETLVRKM
jgi:hypothetical protein